MSRITVSMPIYKRPKRTERAIKCILNQTLQDFEAFLLGDGCPIFDDVISKLNLDNRFICKNWEKNMGGSGYIQTNFAIQHATSPYFVFFANDDCISPCHLKVYLDAIEDTDYDFVYFDYLVFNKLHKTKLKYGQIGHNALIIKTEFLKQMPLHGPEFGHDFELIKNMLKTDAKHKKQSIIPTYYIMSTARNRFDMEGID